jgi:hypothetical protein
MSVELKSTGTLIDEFITTTLKIDHFGKDTALIERLDKLDTAIAKRVSRHPKSKYPAMSLMVLELRSVLKKCWDAQELVMKGFDNQTVAMAAQEAQRLNAERNKLIRKIDEELNEAQYTQLEKSYA